jgi:DNA-binding NtrC family response regulator
MSRATKLGVLVIDDDEDVCLYLREFLTREGFRPKTVSRSADALAEVKEGRYRVVLLDLRMPGAVGASLLREIRAIDSDLCVIAMSAYPSVESAVETLRADANDYLRKPFELDQLRGVLQRAVREQGLLVDADGRLNQRIGSKLRTLRKGRAFTLKQLASRTGLSVSLISQIELGKSAASVSTLYKLSGALDVTMSQLFDAL